MHHPWAGETCQPRLTCDAAHSPPGGTLSPLFPACRFHAERETGRARFTSQNGRHLDRHPSFWFWSFLSPWRPQLGSGLSRGSICVHPALSGTALCPHAWAPSLQGDAALPDQVLPPPCAARLAGVLCPPLRHHFPPASLDPGCSPWALSYPPAVAAKCLETEV